MGFSNQERINMNSKALAAAVIDANPIAQWYETRNPFAFLLNGSRILTELDSIPVAASLAAARTNATNNPTLISDLSQTGSAIRLTAVPGTNNTTWLSYSTYNDTSSTKLDNWIQPQLISQSSGAASIGYAVVLYDGDPAGAGTEITTTDGTTGTGENKTVGWIWNYALGMLLLSDDFVSSVSNPYVMGFRYIGTSANAPQQLSSTLIADQTIVAGQVIRMALNGEVGLTAGRGVKAQSNSLNGSGVVGIATSGAVQGGSFSVADSGIVAVTFGSVPATTSNGQKVYLSASVSGEATLTPPSSSGNVVVELGRLKGANGSDATVTIFLNVDLIVILA